MKRMFKGLLMSFSMFSIIPIKNTWDEKATNLVISFFPLVGFIIGLIWYLASKLLLSFNVPELIKSFFIMIIPYFLTGFIHVDGYMDTIDGIFSRRSLDEKRRILKDSSVGAFAVVGLCLLFMLNFILIYSSLELNKNLMVLVFIPVLSRAIVGISLLNLKLISKDGFGGSFAKDTNLKHTLSLIFFALLSLLCIIYLKGFYFGILFILFEILAINYVYKDLDGMSGDLCGFILVVTEVFALLLIVLL